MNQYESVMGIGGSQHQQTLLTFTEAMLTEGNFKPTDENTPYDIIRAAFSGILILSENDLKSSFKLEIPFLNI